MPAPYLRAAHSFYSFPLSIRARTSPRPRLSFRPRQSQHVPQRPASTASVSSATAKSSKQTVVITVLSCSTIIAFLGIPYLYLTDTRAAVHRYVVPPLLRSIFPDAEDAHEYGTTIMKALHDVGMHPRERITFPSSILGVEVFDQKLDNQIGISAGLDKHADIPDALFALGASVVEVGGCTPLPQAGNPKPRVFRVPLLDGMVNRYGLNSKGADVMAIQLRDRLRKFALSHGVSERQVLDGEAGVPPGSLHMGKMLCVQIAKNKNTDEKDVVAVAKDYVYCVRRLAPFADVLVVNVSSPNTPGLRDLQAVEPLSRILAAVVEEAKATDRKSKPKVMVKVSPDEDGDAQIDGIVQAVWMSGVDGVIVGNTTTQRSGLALQNIKLTLKEKLALAETGGYSGPQLFDKTLGLVRRYRKMLDEVYRTADENDPRAGKDADPDQKVIFATGGIVTGEQAKKVIDAGASVAMTYTGIVYGGAGTVTRLKREMVAAFESGKNHK